MSEPMPPPPPVVVNGSPTEVTMQSLGRTVVAVVALAVPVYKLAETVGWAQALQSNAGLTLISAAIGIVAVAWGMYINHDKATKAVVMADMLPDTKATTK